MLNINILAYALPIGYCFCVPCLEHFLGSPSLFRIWAIIQLLFWNIVGASVVLMPIQNYVVVLAKPPDILNSGVLLGPLN